MKFISNDIMPLMLLTYGIDTIISIYIIVRVWERIGIETSSLGALIQKRETKYQKY